MANRPKAPMPVAERAKQFLPFAGLKGLQEALDAKASAAERAADGNKTSTYRTENAQRDTLSGM